MVIKLMARGRSNRQPATRRCHPRAGRRAQIAYVVCRECGGATADGAGIVVDVEPAMLERAKCDAEDIGDLDADVPARVNSTVTPRTRRQVFARDRHKCAVPTCRAARCLDIHHLMEQMHGGTHKILESCHALSLMPRAA